MRTSYSPSDAEHMHWPILSPAQSKEPYPAVVMDRPVCVVGARVVVHLPLESQQISKARALVVQETDGVYLRDLSSKNQTFVNGQPVSEARLQAGDTVQFGPFKYRCESGFDRQGDPAPIAPAELLLEPDGLASRRTVSIEHYTFLIGTRHGCDLMLRGPDIALAHAVIFVRDGQRYLRDLSSMTGTFVNDQRIREVELHAGDKIRIADSEMEFQAMPARATQDTSSQPQSPHVENTPDPHLPWDETDDLKVVFEDEELVTEGSNPIGR